MDEPVYRFENYCREHDLPLSDEAYKIVLNASSSKLNNTKLHKFLKFVHSGKSEDKFTESLLSAVKKAKLNKEWRTEYMTLLMRDNMNRAEGLAEGKTTATQLFQKLLRKIQPNTKDYEFLLNASYEELEKLAKKYNIEP